MSDSIPNNEVNEYPVSIPGTVVLYQCPDCDAGYETTVRVDRLSSCRSDGCEGLPRRVWKLVSFNRVPGGGRD